MDACPSCHPAMQGGQFAPVQDSAKTKNYPSLRITAKPGHCCFKKSTICAWWLVTRCVPGDARTRERKRASEFPRQQRSICCDSKTRALRRRASRPLSTGLRSQVPDSSSQRENLISLFGPNFSTRLILWSEQRSTNRQDRALKG